MTRAFVSGGVEITVTRTSERAYVMDHAKEIVTRNIWVGDNGKKYVLYRGKFEWVLKGEACYNNDYDYFM